MIKTLCWKKKIFGENYHVYDGAKPIGYLRSSAYAKNNHGTINGRRYKFINKGFLNQNSIVIEDDTYKPIGRIVYNSWMSKARIYIDDKVINWQYANVWNTKWTLSDRKELLYFCQKNGSGGSVGIKNGSDDLLVLCSLFVANYYQQMSVVAMVAVFIPLYFLVF